ncbi:MAG: hypothetical protein M1815_000043 [Lichina confinis]|nr:MAG: hypothetical protein M1815_000043 [Lichina confinis]
MPGMPSSGAASHGVSSLLPTPRSTPERPARLTSAGSSDSCDSDASAMSVSQSELCRCLRCQRTLSGGSESSAADVTGDLGWTANGDGRVRLGYNLYYCARCANLAGLKG